MRPDGSIELWDESYLPGYQEIAVQVNPDTGRPYRQRRYQGARINDLFVMVGEALGAYQGYFVKHPYEPFRGWFQFARYIAQGDLVYNRTTGDVYTVEALLNEENGGFQGQVVLSGGTDPTETDRLRLDQKNLIVYSHENPRSEVSSSKFDATTERTDNPAPFNDTIEGSQLRYEPGTVGKRPFDRERQALPITRESNLDDLVDPDVGIEVKGWWFDHIVQFDLYGKTNRRLDGEGKLDSSGDPGLVAWFQDFMMRYRWVFLWNGIQQLLEWQGTRDKPVGNIKNDMVHRPLLYYVRTERISMARVRRISQIDVLLSIGAPSELVEQTGCPAPTGQIDMTINDFGLYRYLGGL
jgi:hypothetical protein